MDDFRTLNELAGQLQTLDRCGGLTTFKAMISVPTVEITLEDALDLSYQTDGFSLRREVCSPDDYARNELKKCDIPLRDELLAYCSLWDYGKKLMGQNLAVTTAYGVLRPMMG